MDRFIVSARKYRPGTFDEVVGQEQITRTLKNAIRNGQLAQAFLFCGPRGVGKTTCARILARTINCLNPTENLDPCNECESCVSFRQNNSFNIYELDAASNNSVDDIRNLVEKVRIPPQVGNYKVYIIDEVHMLSTAAFNAFLKTLEEPPPYAKFILATTEKHKIIPTILSRCQIYDFRRIGVQDIVHHLDWVASQEGVEAEAEALHTIAVKADGALRDALSIFDQLVSFSGKKLTYRLVADNLNVLDHEFYFQVTEMIARNDLHEALLLIDKIVTLGFDEQHFIIGLSDHLRNFLVVRDTRTASLLEVPETLRERYLKESQVFTTDQIVQMIEIATRCDLEFKNSNNRRLLVELAIMQMCRVVHSGYPEPAEKSKSSEKGGSYQPRPVKKPSPVAGTPQPEKPKAETALSVTEPPEAKSVEQKSEQTDRESTPSKPAASGKRRRLPGSVSLRNQPENDVIKEDNTEKPISDLPAEPVTEDQLLEVWNEVIGQFEKQPDLHIVLKSRPPRFIPPTTIELWVDNKLQLTELESRKLSVMEPLREKLSNHQLQMDVKVIPQEERTAKPFSPKEKFEKMAERNPALKDFKNQLNLDIDF
ncbi:MAG: DNA polymerase III subunit gamma/tau [Bacteroidales bacterium]